MAVITITDQATLTASLELRDGTPLILAGLKKLRFPTRSLVTGLATPINLIPMKSISIGLDLDAPDVLMSAAHLVFGGAMNAAFSVYTSTETGLFGDDEFAPTIRIGSDECWAGLCLTGKLDVSITAPAGGLGVAIRAATEISCETLVHFPAPGMIIPSFKEGLAFVLESYAIPNTSQRIRGAHVGIAQTAGMYGTISLGASYSAPLQLVPLATLNGPLNFEMAPIPAIKAGIEASIELTGSFVVRSYLSSESKLILGIYKKKQTMLTASLSGMAGIGVDVGGADILSAVLNAIVPGADVDALGLDKDQQGELRQALKACTDQSVSVALNACCSASVADEAAVVYELDLSSGDMTLTDRAIDLALQGDWSGLASLTNARLVRNIVKDLHDRNHKLTIHLLGWHNAASVSDYIKSSTVLHDEHGQISLTDTLSARKLSLGTTPYAANAEKLRSAFAQATVATIAYGAAASKINLQSFTMRQTLLEYRSQATSTDLRREIFLARAVDVVPGRDWDDISRFFTARSNSTFATNRFQLEAVYDVQCVMGLFYRDTEKRIPHTPADLDRIGRDTKIALLDPALPNSAQRRVALSEDNIWDAMRQSGNLATFKLIPGLAKLSPTALGAIGADFVDICWWSDALQCLTPRLTTVLTTIDESQPGDLLNNPAFLSARRNLENALGNLTLKTQGSFGDGWGVAVMYRLLKSIGGPTPSIEMDLDWNRHFEHYQTGAQISVGQASSN